MSRGSRDWPTYLHWWAAGDELPGRTPDRLLDLWPSRPLQWLVCRLFGHTPDTDGGITYCIWCQRLLPTADPTPHDTRTQP